MALNINFNQNKVLKARSPILLTIGVDNADNIIKDISVSIKVYNGDKVTDKPTTPIYTLDISNESYGNTFNNPLRFDLSEFCREKINTNKNTYDSESACWLEVSYQLTYQEDVGSIDEVMIGTLSNLVVNGYADYMSNDKIAKMLYLPSKSISINSGRIYPITFLDVAVAGDNRTLDSIEVLYDNGDTDSYTLPSSGTTTSSLFRTYLLQIPVGASQATVTTKLSGTTVETYTFKEIPETKFDKYQLGYIDRNGVFGFIHTNGKSEDSLLINRNEYQPIQDISLMGTYNTSSGQYRINEINCTEELTVNTGWVNEAYNNLVRDFLLSEYTFIQDEVEESINEDRTYLEYLIEQGYTVEPDSCNEAEMYDTKIKDTTITFEAVPVIPQDSQMIMKKVVDEKLINYKFRLKKAYNAINNVF